MNAATVGLCYPSFAAKRREFPRVIIPGIFDMAAEGARDPDAHGLAAWLTSGDLLNLQRGPVQLMALHEHARAGGYRRASQPCDFLQPIHVTIEQGGPCSAWAVVLGAVLTMLGYNWRVVTAGDALDPYRHTYVQAFFGGEWFTLDCKGSQRGQEFDSDAARQRYAITQEWRRA